MSLSTQVKGKKKKTGVFWRGKRATGPKKKKQKKKKKKTKKKKKKKIHTCTGKRARSLQKGRGGLRLSKRHEGLQRHGGESIRRTEGSTREKWGGINRKTGDLGRGCASQRKTGGGEKDIRGGGQKRGATGMQKGSARPILKIEITADRVVGDQLRAIHKEGPKVFYEQSLGNRCHNPKNPRGVPAAQKFRCSW